MPKILHNQHAQIATGHHQGKIFQLRQYNLHHVFQNVASRFGSQNLALRRK
ncbi:MAG: hypothetical protein F6K08_32565 [Okeania sp. SIO1H6]|nr:hypothetical protein [Okeania sp. SIO1H6]